LTNELSTKIKNGIFLFSVNAPLLTICLKQRRRKWRGHRVEHGSIFRDPIQSNPIQSVVGSNSCSTMRGHLAMLSNIAQSTS